MQTATVNFATARDQNKVFNKLKKLITYYKERSDDDDDLRRVQRHWHEQSPCQRRARSVLSTCSRLRAPSVDQWSVASQSPATSPDHPACSPICDDHHLTRRATSSHPCCAGRHIEHSTVQVCWNGIVLGCLVLFRTVINYSRRRR